MPDTYHSFYGERTYFQGSRLSHNKPRSTYKKYPEVHGRTGFTISPMVLVVVVVTAVALIGIAIGLSIYFTGRTGKVVTTTTSSDTTTSFEITTQESTSTAEEPTPTTFTTTATITSTQELVTTTTSSDTTTSFEITTQESVSTAEEPTITTTATITSAQEYYIDCSGEIILIVDRFVSLDVPFYYANYSIDEASYFHYFYDIYNDDIDRVTAENWILKIVEELRIGPENVRVSMIYTYSDINLLWNFTSLHTSSNEQLHNAITNYPKDEAVSGTITFVHVNDTINDGVLEDSRDGAVLVVVAFGYYEEVLDLNISTLDKEVEFLKVVKSDGFENSTDTDLFMPGKHTPDEFISTLIEKLECNVP